MTTIVPQNSTPLPVQVPPPSITIGIENPPTALTQLPTGAVINAQVIGRLENGITELNTVFGKLAIKTALSLPENAKLDMLVFRVTSQLQLEIKSINNVKIQSQLNKPTNLLANTQPQLFDEAKNSATTSIKLIVGAHIKATLLRPIDRVLQSLPPTTGQAQSHQRAGGPLEVLKGKESIKDILKNTVVKVIQAAKNTVGRTQNNPPDSKTDLKVGLQPGTILKAGTQFELKLIGAGNTSSATKKNNKATPNVINGTVVATTPSGQPIMQTPLGMMAFDTRVPLLPGQILKLEIFPSQTQVPTITSAETRFESMFQSRDWPNLKEAIGEIAQASPAIAQKLIWSTLPQPNTQLTSNTLFFLNALKGGDIRSWMGHAGVSLLAQINPELFSQLEEDFAQLGRAVIEPQTNDWRTSLVPFSSGMGLEQFQMHTRGQFEKGDDGKENKCTRFIIDVSLSRLGRIQLDGFVRGKGKRLDLIVRSDSPLPKKMRRDISKVYIDFTEAVAVSGQITFQADQKFVEISMPQLTDHPNKGIVI